MAIKLFNFIDKVLGTDLSKNAASVDSNVKNSEQVFENKAIQQEGNVDKTNITNKDKRTQMYTELGQLFDEYRMDMDLLKEKNFLEEICGKSIDSLTKAEKEQLVSAIKATLHRDWKAFWKDRDAEDIDDIIKYAKHQYNRQQVDATWLGQKWNNLRTEKTLQDELVDTGIIPKGTNLDTLSDEEFKLKVREYVKQEFLGDLTEASLEQKQRRYNRARKQFVFFVNRFETDREKMLLSAAIDEMDSASKHKLSEILINSCGCDTECKGHVAKNVYDEVDVTKKDAFDKAMSTENATSFYDVTYANMFEEDAKASAEKVQTETRDFMKSHSQDIDNIKKKQAAGIPLEAWEADLLTEYNNKIVAQTAGATTGISQNVNFSTASATSTISSLLENAEQSGVDNDVLEAVAIYAQSKPEKFTKMTQTEFTKMLDDITEGKYSEVFETVKNNNSNKIDKVSYKNTEEKENNEKLIEDNTRLKNEKNEKVQTAQIESKKTDKTVATETQTATVPDDFTTPKTRKVIVTKSNASKVEKERARRTAEANDVEVCIPKTNDFETYIKIEGKAEGYKKYVADHGQQEALVEAFVNDDLVNQNIIKRDYKRQNSDTQFDIIRGCGTDLDKPLEWSKDSTIVKLDGVILNCYYATKKAGEAVAEMKEKQG